MTIKIPVEVELSGIAQKVKEVEREIEQAQAGGGIGFDPSGLERDLDRLKRKVDELTDAIKKQGAAQVAAAEQAAAAAKKAADAMADATAKAAAEREAAAKAAAAEREAAAHKKQTDELNKQREAVDKLHRAHEALKRFHDAATTPEMAMAADAAFDRLKHGNTKDSPFLRGFNGLGDWYERGPKMFPDPTMWDAHRKNIEGRIFPAGATTPPPPIIPPTPPDEPEGKPSWWSHLNTRAAGSAAGVAANSLFGGGGLMGAVGGGLGGFFGGPIGGALGMAVGGAIDQSMDKAITEAMTASNLRRSLGGLSIEFGELTEVARMASGGLLMTSTEFLDMERRFAHAANTLPSEAESLVQDVRGAVQFGHGYGMEGGQSTQFFATARQFGVTKDDEGSRKLAFLIGEAVQKGGAYSKADEVMTAIQNYTASAGRAALMAPNVGGYADILANLIGEGKPFGRDVGGAASTLARADAAMRNPGGGEAMQNFKLGAFQRAMDRNVSGMDLDLLLSGGMFSRPEDAIDKALRTARTSQYRSHLMAIAGSSGAGKTNLDIQLDALESNSMGSEQLYYHGMKQLLGVSYDEASALDAARRRPGGLTGLRDQLSRLGVDTANMPIGNIAAITQLMGADRGTLDQQAARLRSGEGYKHGLSKDELARLDTAQGKGEGAYRDEIIRLSASRELTDIGQESLRVQKSMETALTSLSANFLPMMTNVRDAILVAGDKSLDNLSETQKKWAMKGPQSELDAAVDAFSGKGGANRRKNIEVLRWQLEHNDRSLTPQERLRYEMELETLEQAERQAPDRLSDAQRRYDSASKKYDDRHALSRLDPDEMSAMTKVAGEMNIPPDVFAKIIALEGSGRHAVSPKGAMGRMQVMPGNFQPNEDPFDAEDNFRAAGRVYQNFLKHYGGDTDAAIAAYNGGWKAGDAIHNGRRAPTAETRKYMERYQGMKEGTPLPRSHRNGGAEKVSYAPFRFEHQITVVDRDQVPRADPLIVTHFGAPRIA